ncbi:MAG: molybdate ABC transporter substrate-binding protein [Coriobacteriales bacterium]|nr:molybdate ABC transporter substrate-binding protein [Coriobacteriales bacterium]
MKKNKRLLQDSRTARTARTVRKSPLWASRAMVAALALMLALFGLFGCAQPAQDGGADGQAGEQDTPAPSAPVVELQAFAANSLEKALPEVQALYTKANPNVTFADTQFKGSGDLVAEIEGGAAPDLLITASKGSMDNAVENGSMDEGSRRDMFANDLVIARAIGSDTKINALTDVLGEGITSIAIGDADAVPAGQYANQALFTIGAYSDESGKEGSYDAAIEPKLSIAASVGNAAKYVESGDCQIGFVYSSDIFRFPGIETVFVLPADTHKPIVYPGAVLKGSANAEVAADFLAFCQNDPEAQRVWAQYGFEVL